VFNIVFLTTISYQNVCRIVLVCRYEYVSQSEYHISNHVTAFGFPLTYLTRLTYIKYLPFFTTTSYHDQLSF